MKVIFKLLIIVVLFTVLTYSQYNFPVEYSKYANLKFTDCSQGCNFPSSDIIANQSIGFISLPSTFQLSFQYNVQVSLKKPGNIIDIYSLSLNSSLLSLYLNPKSNKISVYYLGNLVINKGLSIVESTSGFNNILVVVDYLSLSVSNGVDPAVSAFIIPNSVSSEKNIFFASNIIADKRLTSAGGRIANFQIHGPMCCPDTTYSPTEIAQCNNAASYTPDVIVSTCSACISYQCVDWTLGSVGMTVRESDYFRTKGDRVYFAVGAYGSDPSRGGLCYRLTVPNVDKDIIAQVITTSSSDSFQVLMGDGGLGYYDACTPDSTSVPQYLSSASKWGPMYGGAVNQSSCSSLPSYPICSLSNQDDLRSLCEWSFAGGFRTANQSTVSVSTICPVACPAQLYQATGLHRLDEPTSVSCVEGSANIVRNAKLGSYMDCAAPGYSSSSTIVGSVDPLFSSVTPCRRDGYTRIDSLPEPTLGPVGTPPTRKPTIKPITPATTVEVGDCCASYSYADYNWNQCANAANPLLGNVPTCATCVSYFCLDWLPGSSGMAERESSYFNSTGDKVYFAVGSYGYDASRGGFCYRLKAESVDRDIIVQVINQADGDVNIYMAGGGLGATNACTKEGSDRPQYTSTESQWGDIYGGWPTRDQCARLPPYPACGNPDFADNLQYMCDWSFKKGFRLETEFNYENSNPIITQMCQVQCPNELWQSTGIKRNDEGVLGQFCSYTYEPSGVRLNRQMDCAKPYFASPYRIGSFAPGHEVVVPCKRDGYSRINSLPTAPPSAIPTLVPTRSKAPTQVPTPVPSTIAPTVTNSPTQFTTNAPTQDAMCCANTVYSADEWPNCQNSATAGSSADMTCENSCLSYQCIDWYLQSKGMRQREAAFYARTKDRVYLGVGSYGNDQSRAGFCYRMTLTGVDRDLIAQVVTVGGDTPDGNFNIVMADGGFSDEYNACVAGSSLFPIFSGDSSVWGGPSGGWLNNSGCDLIPKYPICGMAPQDDMQMLCRQMFLKGFRSANYTITNPTITNMCQVACPSELVAATGLQRTDEKTARFKCTPNLIEPSGGSLSRSMDCARPSYSWGVNIGDQKGRVIPCRRDGYTRINALPQPNPTSVPVTLTALPIALPTTEPTDEPTASPSLSEMCCEFTSYAPESNWRACSNAGNPSLGQVHKCDTCLSYQCIDWTAGSVSMQQREASFLQNSGVKVYFGVGAYSNNPNRAGQCYRLAVKGVDRDVIVQVVDQGPPVADGNFQILLGAGGFDSNGNNACTENGGAGIPMYPGSQDQWGVNGAWSSIDGCNELPPYPSCAMNLSDSMVDLCRWGFQKGLKTSTTLPKITSMCQVKCPQELYQATGLRRADEPVSEYFCTSNTAIATTGVLSKGMSCSKPAYAWLGVVNGQVDPSFPAVIPCRRDGYTRINVLGQQPPTPIPTLFPTRATKKPTTYTAPNTTTTSTTQRSKAADAWFFEDLLSTQRGLIILSVSGFVFILIVLVFCCEICLRRKRVMEVRQRFLRRQRMNSTRGTANRKGEYLKNLASAADSINSSGLSYSEYLEATNMLMRDDDNL